MNRLLPKVDLAAEPAALSIVENPETGRVALSDIPERLIPRLIETFGADAVGMVLEPSEVQGAYNKTLKVTTRARARHRDLHASGELGRRVERLRAEGRLGGKATYFMAAINRSDEAILGRTGILYFVCKKGCHFCHYRYFDEYAIGAEDIAARMLAFQRAGADDVQWLSPTSYTPLLIEATWLAVQEGFTLPIIHKSEGEDSLADLALLDGVVDMYLPDAKFISPEFARWIGLPQSYPDRMRAAIAEMYRQVGPLARTPGPKPLQGGGVLVRHLLMPGGRVEATRVLDFLCSIDQDFPVRIMTSYEPVNEAKDIPAIARRVTREEIDFVAGHAHELEMHCVLMG
jgi:putative pyruvate formate lyase activating enzyme